ncbi:hypothetical protein ANN_04896 [Periplaneta americana]|uniref:Uncharacterized protein n=1 Tax=Periplaneta americana TaxID=6978 RepID=A0ABQ8TAG5_PERAM|nr:hypothetical protein ANN_04896 [Periplaneta americana]
MTDFALIDGYVFWSGFLSDGSRAVASRSKASCLGLALRNARWFESSWGKKFSHEISASVWDRCPPSSVMHLGSYDRRTHNGLTCTRSSIALVSNNGSSSCSIAFRSVVHILCRRCFKMKHICRRTVALLHEYSTLYREFNQGYGTTTFAPQLDGDGLQTPPNFNFDELFNFNLGSKLKAITVLVTHLTSCRSYANCGEKQTSVIEHMYADDNDEHEYDYEEHENDYNEHEDNDEHEYDYEEHENDYNEHEDDNDEHEYDYEEHENDSDEHEDDNGEHEYDYEEHENDYNEHEDDTKTTITNMKTTMTT